MDPRPAVCVLNLSAIVLTIQREINMTRGMSGSIFFWQTLVRAAAAPRDPNDDQDEGDEEDGGDEDDDREPGVIREPDAN
jgi:hypothetical protein